MNKEYEKQFQQYLIEQGPNTGTGVFGKWAWYAKQKADFHKLLKKSMSEAEYAEYIKPTESQATPSTFAEFWKKTSKNK